MMSTYQLMTLQLPVNKQIFFVEIVEINEHGSKPTQMHDAMTFSHFAIR